MIIHLKNKIGRALVPVPERVIPTLHTYRIPGTALLARRVLANREDLQPP